VTLIHQLATDSSHHPVVTDNVYALGRRVMILCENKPPTAFDHFIGQLMELFRSSSLQQAWATLLVGNPSLLWGT
jgi:hypothetical protein